jgi:hypothetical protein
MEFLPDLRAKVHWQPMKTLQKQAAHLTEDGMVL